MDISYLYIVSALVIACAYMIFDVFNKRNVPELFAYATVAFALVLSLIVPNQQILFSSYLITGIVVLIGYLVYRGGQLGAADVIEFGALALLLAPVSLPLLGYTAEGIGVANIFSILVNTGVAAVVFVPLFYLPIAAKRFGRKLTAGISKGSFARAIMVIASYMALAIVLLNFSYTGPIGFAVVFLVMIGSSLLVLFEKHITAVMIEEVSVSRFEEGDIIAFNLMTKKEIADARKKVKIFDRLVTKKLISEMKSKKVKTKFPVYKNAIPLAVPIFVGIVLTVLFGNLLLFVLLG